MAAILQVGSFFIVPATHPSLPGVAIIHTREPKFEAYKYMAWCQNVAVPALRTRLQVVGGAYRVDVDGCQPHLYLSPRTFSEYTYRCEGCSRKVRVDADEAKRVLADWREDDPDLAADFLGSGHSPNAHEIMLYFGPQYCLSCVGDEYQPDEVAP